MQEFTESLSMILHFQKKVCTSFFLGGKKKITRLQFANHKQDGKRQA